jgi:hypothetical protein
MGFGKGQRLASYRVGRLCCGVVLKEGSLQKTEFKTGLAAKPDLAEIGIQ